jgi:hypothetical protein
VTGIARTGLYNVGWSHPNRIPTWLRTDGIKFLMRRWFYYGGERSVHGPAFASDDEGTLLWAWVHNDDNSTIRLVRSTNRGMSWHWVGVPAGAATHGTPGLAWTSVGGQSTWILAWAHFDRADQANTGYVRASISTDNGTSWSPPAPLNGFYKALSGVSIAADASNHVTVALAWAPTSTTWLYGLNAIRSLRCEVAGGQLQQLGVMLSGERTRIQPSVTYDPAHGQFILAWREQNFATTLATARAAPGAASWSGKVSLLGSGSHVAPAAAALPEYDEAVLWYAFEGP